MTYEEKVSAIRSRLGKTASEKILDKLDEHTSFLAQQKKDKEDEEEANKQAEAERHAALVLKQGQEKLAKEEAEKAAEALRQQRMADAIKEGQERRDREVAAREWVSAESNKARAWKSSNTHINAGKPLSKYDYDRMEKAGICEPRINWFDSNWEPKPQFSKYYQQPE
ncbi:hypothetical protein AB4342_01265 [Vibrio breoganii]